MEATENSEQARPLAVPVERPVRHPSGSADNADVLIVWANGATKMWRAKKMQGCFGGQPDAVWTRTLEQHEIDTLLRDPWCIYKRNA